MGILLDEADPNCREVPFHLGQTANPLLPVTLHAWNDIGDGTTDELLLRLPGGSYANAVIANIVEKGYGDYALRLTQLQTAVLGAVHVALQVAVAQFGTVTETIGTQASGIALGETADARRELAFHLPTSADPLAPLTGHAFLAGEVYVALPGVAYVIADHTLVIEKGYGDYALVLTDAQVAARGKIYLYVGVPAAQPWSAAYEVNTFPPGFCYRMRGYDATLARPVYWNADYIDSLGADYTGPGALSDVVVQHLLGT